MKQLNEHHTFTGMQQDLDIALHPAQFLYHAKNVRLTPRNGDTLFAISNEKGTETITNATVPGFYLGHCLLDKYLVVFTHALNSNTPDYISRMDLDVNSPLFTQLYNGNLGFSLEYPIEAIGSYENTQIQKVYWTDGLNQPRVINIAPGAAISSSDDSQFDFVRTLKLDEKISVQKEFNGGGMFAPGVIQYAFTYYTKYGQESNIFYTTPLMYISYRDRGASPEDKLDVTFNIVIKDPDTEHNFDYIRIYSIHRTSINGTPIVNLVHDLRILDKDSNNKLYYKDTGLYGTSIDPTELLYKGGESIKAKTIEQKDNTLFLGNIGLIRDQLTSSDVGNITIGSNSRYIRVYKESEGAYVYSNQLNATTSQEDANGIYRSVPCGGFKTGDYYRLGVQFQHETGKWSDPIFIKDEIQIASPAFVNEGEQQQNTPWQVISLPGFKGTISASTALSLINKHYKRARAVVVFPQLQDRVVQCQGVATPVMFTKRKRDVLGSVYAQSSWFFRPKHGTENLDNIGTFSPKCIGSSNAPTILSYATDDSLVTSEFRTVEIQGDFRNNGGAANNNEEFYIDPYMHTLHCPDIEFDDTVLLHGFNDRLLRSRGYVEFKNTLSSINIQLETPPVSKIGSGVQEKSFVSDGSRGIISGLFYEDAAVTDQQGGADPTDVKYSAIVGQKSPFKWLVYPWNKSGSLNNDIDRPTDQGTRSAVLKKKVISNLRYADTVFGGNTTFDSLADAKIFSDDFLSILKIDGEIYQGNVDTLYSPTYNTGQFLAFGSSENDELIKLANQNVDTPFETSWWAKTSVLHADITDPTSNMVYGIFRKDGNNWGGENDRYYLTDEDNIALVKGKEAVRMKYKSTPHIVIKSSDLDSESNYYRDYLNPSQNDKSILPIIEIVQKGDTYDSQGANPYYRSTMFGGKSMSALRNNTWVPCGEPVSLGDGSTYVEFYYSYGDTYFQRWDCLKTYPFTKEDINQIVEIGSFMLETRVNIDGRYDRNRGQLDNTNMSPENFNLLNPVYSQIDNFFSYKILDEQYYSINRFPNEITWTKEKAAGAEIDAWTNITLGSTYGMDGSKGEVISLNLWRDNIYCFQNKGVSNILFNSRVQIPTSDGVPIEISNSYKVDGYRYLSDGVGCKDARLIKETPAGVYFMDSASSHLYYIGDGLQDVSATHNMTSWFNQNGSSVKKLLYDDVNKDIYLVRDDNSMCYSELLGQFTGFYDYDDIKLIESWDKKTFTMRAEHLYRMFNGDYNYFFNAYKPWEFTFVSNGADQSMQDFEKIFTNVDYRMDIQGSNGYAHDATLDYLRVWNEYQDTRVVELGNKNGAVRYTTYPQNYVGSNVQKKFRVWRLQIPRTKKEKTVEGVTEWVNTNDRIRNTWCKVNLGRRALDASKAILHDLNVQYYV